MTSISEGTIEGRLIAHRQLLSLIVASLSKTSQAAEILSFLEERSAFQGNEEDPGAVPSQAYAIELALADELRLVAERAKGSPEAS